MRTQRRSRSSPDPAYGSVRRARAGLLTLGALLAFGGPPAAEAAAVGFTVTSLGGANWQYNYTLSGSYSAGQDLAIYFPYATSSSLTALGTGGPDWTTFVLQPDSALPADGEFDIAANVTNPSLAPTFSVAFVYSGSGSPGAQSFTLFDSSFNVLQTGTTAALNAPAVPEPGSLGLLGGGLLLFSAIGLAQRSALRSPRRPRPSPRRGASAVGQPPADNVIATLGEVL